MPRNKAIFIGNGYNCPICNFGGGNLLQIKLHLKVAHEFSSVIATKHKGECCKLCGENFMSKKAINKHAKRDHK